MLLIQIFLSELPNNLKDWKFSPAALGRAELKMTRNSLYLLFKTSFQYYSQVQLTYCWTEDPVRCLCRWVQWIKALIKIFWLVESLNTTFHNFACCDQYCFKLDIKQYWSQLYTFQIILENIENDASNPNFSYVRTKNLLTFPFTTTFLIYYFLIKQCLREQFR